MTLLRYTIYGVRRPHDFGGEAAQDEFSHLSGSAARKTKNIRVGLGVSTVYTAYRPPT